jgi:hypothetical protein
LLILVLVLPGFSTPFGDQFVDHGNAWRNKLAQSLLGALETCVKGQNADLVVDQFEEYDIAGLDAEGFAEGRGDHEAAFIIDLGANWLQRKRWFESKWHDRPPVD